MDLKDVIASGKLAAEEAELALNAGHEDRAIKQILSQLKYTEKYFDEHPMPAGDVNESATSEKPTEARTETPAEVPGSPAQPAAVDPAGAARSIGSGSAEPKPPQ